MKIAYCCRGCGWSTGIMEKPPFVVFCPDCRMPVAPQPAGYPSGGWKAPMTSIAKALISPSAVGDPAREKASPVVAQIGVVANCTFDEGMPLVVLDVREWVGMLALIHTLSLNIAAFPANERIARERMAAGRAYWAFLRDGGAPVETDAVATGGIGQPPTAVITRLLSEADLNVEADAEGG